MGFLILGALGAVGAWIASIFGGWDASITTFCIFMGVDYITGLICAGVFHKSAKTTSGGLDSREGLKGLLRKGVMLLVVLIAVRLDILLDVNYIRDAVVITFIINEGLSIVENLGLMGVPLPDIVSKALNVLRGRTTSTDDKSDDPDDPDDQNKE